MHLVTSLDQYEDKYIYFMEPIKNTVIPNSNFIRIYYSNNDFILNGIYILLDIYNMSTEKYYNKFKCTFDKNINMEIVNKLKDFEIRLLEKFNSYEKTPQYTLFNQLTLGSLKIFSDQDTIFKNNMKFILKVSGIWENLSEYGITYKFIPIYN